jgi:hypothetical protein
MDEIRFMKSLGGNHLHLLNMLACVTDAVNPVLIIEFCEHGDLLRVLRENKQLLGTQVSHHFKGEKVTLP